MRCTLLLTTLAFAGPVACKGDTAPGGDESDADTDSDTDTDTDADLDDAGDDIDSAKTIAYSDATEPAASDAIGSAGDRDFFALEMAAGEIAMLYTEAYAVDGEVGNPDTVLRVLDPSGTLLVENDDMPSRLQETDSAVYFQAPTSETFYIEILEWSDWDPTAEGPEGGSDWDYDLYAFGMSVDDSEDAEPNDTQADVDQLVKDGKPTYYNNFFDADYPSDFYGTLSSATDVDMWRVELKEPEFLTVILYPGYWPAADLQVSMYDPAGYLVAQTDSPEFSSDDIAYEDAALIHFAQPGAYYFAVEDSNGTVGAAFGGLVILYIESNSEYENENNDVIATGNPVTFDESDTVPGYFFGRMTGAVGASGDDADCFTVSATDVGDDMDGTYLLARTQATTVGSLLDPKITVYEDDGSTVIVSATTSDQDGSADAGVTDIEIPDDQTAVYVCVEAESADAYADANQYILQLEVSPEPLFD
jgi:hypothetical protein